MVKKRDLIPSFDELHSDMQTFVETNAYEDQPAGNVEDPDPNPAGEPEWDEGEDTTPKKPVKSLKIQLF